jgi:tRNA G18 (ribose-2'-O)-methylase SpoU
MKVVSFTQKMENTIHIARTAECFGFEFYSRFFDNQHRNRARVPKEELFPVSPADMANVQNWRSEGWQVYALQENGLPPDHICWAPKSVILVGRETGGIPNSWQDLVHQNIWIPLNGKTASLNAADAAVIVMYEASRIMNFANMKDVGGIVDA